MTLFCPLPYPNSVHLGLPRLFKRQAVLCPLKANIDSQLEVTALIGLVFDKQSLWSHSAQNAVLTRALARLPHCLRK